MKKLFCVVLIVLTLSSLSACGSEKDKRTTDNQAPNPSVSQNQTTEKSSESAPTTSKSAQSADGIDVDLTKLSSTMVYSEVYNMMYTPDDYIGKTVKIKGQFAIGYVYNTDGTPDESTARFTCVIADATACCSQGLEFALAGRPVYPDEYPERWAESSVERTLEGYEEDGCRYDRLDNATCVR